MEQRYKCKGCLSNDFCNSNTRGQELTTAYTVIIEEHISREFAVEACGLYQAMQIAKERYRQGLYVVYPSAPCFCSNESCANERQSLANEHR